MQVIRHNAVFQNKPGSDLFSGYDVSHALEMGDYGSIASVITHFFTPRCTVLPKTICYHWIWIIKYVLILTHKFLFIRYNHQ